MIISRTPYEKVLADMADWLIEKWCAELDAEIMLGSVPRKAERCGVCNDAGKVICPGCNGRKWTTCARCRGAGSVRCPACGVGK